MFTLTQTRKSDMWIIKGYLSCGLLFINNNIILTFKDENTINIWDLNEMKLFKEFEKLDFRLCHDEIDLHNNLIDAGSKGLAVFTQAGDINLFNFSRNLRKEYLKYL